MTTESGGNVGTTSSRTDVCMDQMTGFVQGKRVRRGGALERDLYSFYTYDASNGNTTSEAFFGGDLPAFTANAVCSPPGTAAAYKLLHAYDKGVRRESKYEGVAFKSADLEVEGNTSLPKLSRDPALVPANYEYDNMGRLTAIRPTGSAWTKYSYTTASEAAPASVTATQWKEGEAAVSGNELTIGRYFYDGFGRVVQQSSRMPGSWSTTWIEYDVLGRKTRESTPQSTATGDYAAFPATAKTMRWAHDALGRTVSVTQPDEAVTTFSYTGSRETKRKVSVATSEGAQAPVSVVETLDGLGRLIKVTEDADGAAYVTNYDYDVADRLRTVRIQNGTTNVRQFFYDDAGLMTSEVHPESSTRTYGEYDARGHVSKRTTTPATTVLTYEYDKAERLINVKADGLPFKKFVFDRATGGDDKSLGKLDYAIRYNRHPAFPGGEQQVRETYRYKGPGGAISEKVTDAGSQSFSDEYHYDDLGAVKTVDYPTCTGCVGLSAPERSVSTTRSFGVTTGVESYAKDIQYHANGMLSQIRHLNSDGTDGPLYQQFLSTADTMARPARITVSYYCKDLNPTPPAPLQQTVGAAETFAISINVPAGATSAQWYERTATGESFTGQTGPTFNGTAGVTRSYFVRFENDTCSADSAVATVNVATTCASPSVAIAMPQVLVASVTTTAAVSPTPGATYEWTLEGSGVISNPNAATISFTPGCSGSVKLKVKVTTNCVVEEGASEQMPIEPPKAVVSGSQTIPNRTAPAQIQVALSGLGPWSVTWSDGHEDDVPLSTPNATRLVTPVTDQQTYAVTSVTDAAGCVGTAEGSATVTVAAPTCTVPPSSDFDGQPSYLSSDVYSIAVTPVEGTRYEWTISNGQKWLDTPQNRLSFKAGCSGVVTITLIATSTDPSCGLSSRTTKSFPLRQPHAIVEPATSVSKVYVRGDPPLPITFQIEGVGATVRWSDGTVQSNLNMNPSMPRLSLYTRSVQPVETTTYSIVDVRDFYGCPGTSSDSVVVVVCDPPVVDIQAPSAIAADEIVTASVLPLPGATYSWMVTGGSIVGGATTPTVTFQPALSSCTGAVSVAVTVTTSCGVTRNSTTTVPLIPTEASVSGTATIAQGNSTPIHATLTGVGPWMVRWSDRENAEQVSISPHTRSVAPAGTFTYTVTAATDSRGCAAATSGEAEVTVIPPAPATVAARAVTTTHVAVSWSYSGEADQFIVQRNGATIATLATPAARSYADTAVTPAQAYVYRVIASKSGVDSSPSAPDLATTVIFEDDPLLSVHGIRAQHILQLRAAVAAVRGVAGLAAPVFTDSSPAMQAVKAVHFNELWTMLDEARLLLGLPGIGYTRLPLQVGYEIWVMDVTAVRGGVQ